jgi:PHD/YefM family antitoxin component YafN of YafNO toxin-antitoxin module
MITMPQSKFRREMKKWLKYIDKNPDEIIVITSRNIKPVCMINYKTYENLLDTVKE